MDVERSLGPTNRTSTPGNRRNLAHVLKGAHGLDLDHAEQRIVDILGVAAVAAEVARPVIGGDPSVTRWRVPEVAKRLADLVRRVETGKHDARDAEVEHVSDADALGRLDAHDHRYAVGRTGEDLAGERLFATRTVLEVDQQPVKAAHRAHFGREGRAEVEHRPAGRAAGSNSFT